MKTSHRTWLPAAGHDWLLPLYDPLVKLIGVDSDRKKLVAQSDIQPGHRILDIGCGTGTLSIWIRRLYKDIEVTGIDPDPKALTRAEYKAERMGASIRFDRGFSDQLPYSEATFDRVFSTFMFHHLGSREEKEKTLHEVFRVLKPEGSFLLLDIVDSKAKNNRKSSFLTRQINSSHRLRDNSEETILSMMNKTGFSGTKITGSRRTFLRRIVSFRAAKY